MATVLDLTFSGGTDEGAVTAANSGWDECTGTPATYENTDPFDGTYSVNVAVVGGNSIANTGTLTPMNTMWVIFPIKLPTSAPAANVTLMNWKTGGEAGTVIGALRYTPGGLLQLRDGNVLAYTAPALATGVWHRVAIKVNPAGGATGHQMKVYPNPSQHAGTTTIDSGGVPCTNAGASQVDYVGAGALTSSTIDYFYGHVTIDNASEPLPSGANATVLTDTVRAYATVGVRVLPTALYGINIDGMNDGDTLTAGNTGFDSITGTPPVAGLTSNQPYQGAHYVDVTTVGGNTIMNKAYTASVDSWHVFAIRLPVSVAANVTICNWKTGGLAGTVVGRLQVLAGSSRQLRLSDSNTTPIITTVPLAQGLWYRVAIRVNTADPTNGHVLKYYEFPNEYNSVAAGGTVQGSGPCVAAGAASTDFIAFGALVSSSFDIDMDYFHGDALVEPDTPQVNATVTPGSVAAVASVGRPANAQVSKATVAAVAAVGGTAVVPLVTIVAPATVNATARVASFASVLITSTITTSTVTGVATVGNPVFVGSQDRIIAVPASVAAHAAVGAATVVAGTGSFPLPSTVAAHAAVGVPTITLGVATTVTPATVTAHAAVGGSTVASSSAVVSNIATVTAIATVGVVTILEGAPTYVFRTPIRQGEGPRLTIEATPAQVALLRHFRHHQGYPVCVLITDGVVTEKQVPTVDDMQNADYVFMGGRENLVDDPALIQLLIDNSYTLDVYGSEPVSA